MKLALWVRLQLQRCSNTTRHSHRSSEPLSYSAPSSPDSESRPLCSTPIDPILSPHRAEFTGIALVVWCGCLWRGAQVQQDPHIAVVSVRVSSSSLRRSWVVTRTLLLLPLLHRLCNNNIGDEGVAAFGEALKRNKTLTLLQ
jgi:hypothetical protein